MHSTSRLPLRLVPSVCNDRNVFGGLYLDRSKSIFRSGLPTDSLTLTYVHVPVSSRHRRDTAKTGGPLSASAEKMYDRMCNEM